MTILEIIIMNYSPGMVDLNKFKRHLWEYFGEISMDDIKITLKKDIVSIAKWKEQEVDS